MGKRIAKYRLINIIPGRVALLIPYPVNMKTTFIYIFMGQKKGQTGNPKGRPKGSPNKITSSLKEWIKAVIDGNRKQFEKDLKALEPSERIRAINNLLQYVTPKMQSTSSEEQIEKEMQKFRELLFEFPDEAIDRIAERAAELTRRRAEND